MPKGDIIQKHMQAMLKELNAEGFTTYGVAGGVVFRAAPDEDGTPCQVFYLVDADTLVDGKPVTSGAFLQAVAEAMPSNGNHG